MQWLQLWRILKFLEKSMKTKLFGKIEEEKKERDKLPKPFNNILIYCETALLCLWRQRKSWDKMSARYFKTLKTYDLQVATTIEVSSGERKSCKGDYSLLWRGSRHIAIAQYGAINFSFVPVWFRGARPAKKGPSG